MIGERLSELRKDAGMSQQELADMLSLTKYTISSYEREKTMPGDDIKVELAKIFNVSLDYLLGLIDEPIPYKRSDKYIRLPDTLPDSAVDAVNTVITAIREYYK